MKPESKLKVVFLRELAMDDGGPRREFFLGIVKSCAFIVALKFR